MASTELLPTKRTLDDAVLPQPRRFKASDLPLSSTQRASIENLSNMIKKKGEFDILRKKIWSLYADSVSQITYLMSSDIAIMLYIGGGCIIHALSLTECQNRLYYIFDRSCGT